MPFVPQEERLTRLGIGVGQLPVEPEPQEPAFWSEVVPAAFRTENPVVAFFAREPTVEAGVDPDHDPYTLIEGTRYADFPEAFMESGSMAETASIMRRIDTELQDRNVLVQAGWPGLAAGLMAGFLDPINFVPVGGAAYRAIRTGKSVLTTGYASARAGLIGAGLSEATLLSMQETRTHGEAAANVAASTFLSGMLGAGVSALTRRQLTQLAKSIEADMSLEPRIAGASGIDPDRLAVAAEEAAANPTLVENQIVGAFGLEKATAFVRASPGVRIDTKSPSVEARLFRQRLADSPYLYAKNLEGKATPESVETRIAGFYQARLAEVLQRNRLEYVNYRRRLAGKGPVTRDRFLGDIANRAETSLQLFRDVGLRGHGRPLSLKEFHEEIGRAARRLDESPIPEVQSAAKFRRQRLVDPIKDRAVEVGLLPEDVAPEGAASYLTRLYKNPLIERDPDERFRRIVELGLRDKHPDLSEAEALDAAGEIRRTILGTADGRLPYNAELGGGRALKQRGLGFIKDESLEDFLESDVDLLDPRYVRTMASDIELVREFGTVNFDEAAQGVRAEYEARIAEASPKERPKLEKSMAADLRDLGAMWDQLRGTFVTSKHFSPDRLPVRAGRVARQLSYLALGGGFVINSLPDVGVTVLQQGLIRTLGKGVVPFMANTRAAKLTKAELRVAGAALENVLDTRAHSIADIGDDLLPRTGFERSLDAATRNFSLLTLHSPWNTMMKQINGLIDHEKTLQVAEDLLSGRRVKKRDLTDLAAFGIDEPSLRKIGEQRRVHGGRENDLWISNTEAWTDTEIRDRFRNALRNMVDAQIVTPGVADRPPLMSTELGKFVGQFKSFAFATIPRSVIPALQRRDLATFNGMALMTALGMGVYATKELQAGRELSDDPRQWVKEGIDRSGLLGIYSDFNNMLEVATRRQLGFSALMGGPTVSRYAQRNDLGNLLGPSFRLVGNVSDVTGSVSTGEFSQSDVRTLRRMLPYQNVWWLRNLFDVVETGVNQQLGVPARRSRRRRTR